MLRIEYFTRNNGLLADGAGNRPSSNKDKINLNWWHTEYGQEQQNLGDMISPVVYDYMCDYYNLDKDKKTERTKHIYAIGSILFFENQDVTVWGTGALHELEQNMNTIFHQRILRKIDARAVRGPLTRKCLRKVGIKCPEIYGDPAMIMPLIYRPEVERGKKILILTHLKDTNDINTLKDTNIIVRNTISSEWRDLIDLIVGAKFVITSSLHGIILAESYGVPAVLLAPKKENDLFKYKDYYFGTERTEIPVVNSFEEGIAFNFGRWQAPDIQKIQERLIKAFPIDLWEK